MRCLSTTGTVCAVSGTKRVSEIVGTQVHVHRNRRGWTQRELEAAVASHGGTLSRGALAKIESGVRRVSMDEWLLLAAALNVPPPLLLVPLGSSDLVEITSSSVIHPHLALDWLVGDQPLASTGQRLIGIQEWHTGAAPLYAWRKYRRLQEAEHTARAAVMRAEHTNGGDEVREAKRRHADTLEALHHHMIDMQGSGLLRIAAMPPETLEDMRAIGLDVSTLPVNEPQER